LVDPQAHILADGAVQHDKSQCADQQNAAEQWAVDIQAPHHARKVAQWRDFSSNQPLRITESHRHRTPGIHP